MPGSRHAPRTRIAHPIARSATVLLLFVLLLLTGTPGQIAAQQEDRDEAGEDDGELPSIEEKTRGMERMDGFIPIHWEEKTGKVWLEISRFGEELLHYSSLPAGLGSNDIGLDRGQLGPREVVTFERVGRRVLMVQPNYDYRAESDNALERKAVEDAFATSILWGFTVAAETGDRVLVDATDFLIRDAHGVIGTLERSNQGTFRLDSSRSAFYLPRTNAFPQNSEIEVTLTFTSDEPGGLVRSVTPTAGAVTLRQHHSFVELPDDGYEPRRADPRAGYGTISYLDYATPLGVPMEKQYIRRHRLEKRNPGAERSEPVEPIIYYLDPGTPEPVRTALLEGGRWWNQAFEAAGYIDAFRVEMLPEDADPMDIRYNLIQWVHRSTRGWSYGSSVSDPRTGEILKGHVTLGSLRVRQDFLIAEGLLSPYGESDDNAPEVEEMALNRIRQLSAHEIGHTIGLSHNYIASAQERTSVMDYPHPIVRLGPDGTLDFSDAYGLEIGEWDKVAVAYGYQDFPEGTDEDAALESILMEAEARGVTFITDADARPIAGAHPAASLWDEGPEAVGELGRMMEVRRVALDRFGEAAIKQGTPLARMEETLVPLYLHHRYQVEAAVKSVAGVEYTYALRGDGQRPLARVPAEDQRRALDALMRTLDPAELALPESLLEILPPRPPGHGAHRELFPRYTGLTFDAFAPAVVASDLTISVLLHPERAARLVQQQALEPSLPGLEDVVDRLTDQTFRTPTSNAYEAGIAREQQRILVERLMDLARSADMPQVRAVAALALHDLEVGLDESPADAGRGERAHRFLLASEIGRFMERPLGAADAGFSARGPGDLAAPPGSPIGDGGRDYIRWGWEEGELSELRCTPW